MSSRRKTSQCFCLAILALCCLPGCESELTISLTFSAERDQHLTYFVGEINQPSREQISGWLSFVEGFWAQHYPPEQIAAALAVQSVEFVDQERIMIAGRPVHGYSMGRHAVVGVRNRADGSVDWDFVESLFKHELGHGVLGEVGVVWDEQVHHELFASLGYGY